MFDLTSLAWGAFVSIFSVILTVHTRLLTLDRILGRGRWMIHQSPDTWCQWCHQPNIFVKLFHISIEKIFNFERQMNKYFHLCFLHFKRFTCSLLQLNFMKCSFTIDKVRRHHSEVFFFVLSPGVQQRTFQKLTRRGPLLFLYPVPLRDVTRGGQRLQRPEGRDCS